MFRNMARNMFRGDPVALSPNDAAKQVGKSKTTILRAIRSGKLSANKNEDGSYSIDPSELARVYGGGSRDPGHDPEHGAPRPGSDVPGGAPNDPPEISVLQVKLDAAEKLASEREQELHHRDVTITDLRERLDKSEHKRDEAQTKLTALLSDMRPTVSEKPVERRGVHWGYFAALALVLVSMGALVAYLGLWAT